LISVIVTAKSKKTKKTAPGIGAVKYHKNILFLRRHYPDQVPGFGILKNSISAEVIQHPLNCKTIIIEKRNVVNIYPAERPDKISQLRVACRLNYSSSSMYSHLHSQRESIWDTKAMTVSIISSTETAHTNLELLLTAGFIIKLLISADTKTV
jgi:hypothetical protein